MHSASSPDHFEKIPFDITAMPERVETAEASGSELHQLYGAWETFFDEVNGGRHQFPEHVQIDYRDPNLVRIRAESDGELDSIAVWRVADRRDPGISVRYIQHNKVPKTGYVKLDRTIMLHASGQASYKLTKFKPSHGSILASDYEYKPEPSFNDVLLFYDLLRQLTIAEKVDPKKQNIANRFVGWLFRHRP